VLDLKVNPLVKSMFPPPSVVDRFAGVVLRTFKPAYQQSVVRVRDAYYRSRKYLGDLGLRKIKRGLQGVTK
jgi:hypothetical protein